MAKKKMIIITILIIIVIAITIFLIIKSKNKEIIKDVPKTIVSETQYDEETELYYIKNEETDEIISASYNEHDLDFYKEHPDYNPNPLEPKNKTLKDYIINYQEEIIEESIIE